MITHNIFLPLSDAAIFLDVSLPRLRKTVPKQYKTLTLQQIDALGRHFQCSTGAEDQRLVCLQAPKLGWRTMFQTAAYPAEIPGDFLDRMEFYITEAPFLSSIIEILHWLNQSGFYKERSIHAMAAALSKLGAFKLYVIQKGDKIYRRYYSRLMNPPLLEIC